MNEQKNLVIKPNNAYLTSLVGSKEIKFVLEQYFLTTFQEVALQNLMAYSEGKIEEVVDFLVWEIPNFGNIRLDMDTREMNVFSKKTLRKSYSKRELDKDLIKSIEDTALVGSVVEAS